jgi:hypothetical protein
MVLNTFHKIAVLMNLQSLAAIVTIVNTIVVDLKKKL